MDSARWERIQHLFHEAAERPESDRSAFLDRECSEDRTLITEVLALLGEDARGSSILDRDVAHAAHQILGDGSTHTLPLEEFGAYRITRVLGEGGMGVVYLAERSDLGTLAAIKILRDAWLSPARRDRFAAEQRTLAQLDHPSIARLYDADVLADGTPWFVMEYVEGIPLTDYCREHAAPVAERLRLFREVCAAVQHAHQHLVVHRDLKPSNVLVRQEGTVKLLDFGIAKHLEDTGVPADQTRTGVRLMTPAYAAPEQMLGGRVGVHTDVYSLGVMLYELLSGQLPFDLSSKTPGEAETIIVEREPERPSVVAQRLASSSGMSHVRTPSRAAWADLDVLCLTAMHKDPQRRYATVEALVRDVGHYLNGEPLEARPDSVRYRANKFVRRNWRPLAVAAAMLTTVVGLVSFYTLQLAAARNAAVAEAARTQRIQRFTLSLLAGGDESAAPADSLRVVTLVDRGVQEARSLDAEPTVQAELVQTLGEIYHKLGKLDRADSLLNSALLGRRSRLGPDHPDVATSLVAVGLLRSDQAKYDEAEQAIREALDIARRRLSPGHPDVANAAEALGHVLTARGEYDQAVVMFEDAVRLRSASGEESAELAGSLYGLANAHFYAGHYAVSDSINRRLLPVYGRLFGDRHPRVADVLINLGAIQHDQGRHADAVRYYRPALEIKRGWYGEDHHATAAILTMLARPLVSMNEYDEAVGLLRRALAIRERVFGLVHPAIASTVNELGNVALRHESFDDAEAAFRRMIDIYREVYGGKHYLMGIATANLGSVFLAKQENSRAESLFREALGVYAETLAADHLNVGITRIKLGRTLVRQRRFDEAERELRGGYEIVSKQAAPTVSWLMTAREDLAIAYDALGQPDQATRFRAELAQPEPASGGPAARD